MFLNSESKVDEISLTLSVFFSLGKHREFGPMGKHVLINLEVLNSIFNSIFYLNFFLLITKSQTEKILGVSTKENKLK